jgi:outer membrane lipoprotein-sorting protein
MIEATLTMMAALVAAVFWIGFQQRRLTTTTKRLVKAEQRLHSAKLTLTQTKEQNEALVADTMLLKHVLFDVAKGEAYVWIEDGELRATRTADRETPIH